MIAYDLVFQRKNSEAITYLEDTVALEPGAVESHFYLGMVLAVSGQYDRGLEELLYCKGVEKYTQRDNFKNVVLFLEKHYQETGDTDRLASVELLKKEL